MSFKPWTLIFLFPLLLTACGGGDDRPVINFAAALLPAERAPYMEVLKDFEQETGIEVRLVAQQYEQIRSSIEAEAKADHGRLDLVELDLYQLPLLKDAMQPLGGLIENEEELEAKTPADAWAVTTFGDPPALLYLPHRLNWQALIYDAEKIAAPPETWNDLLAIAQAHPGALGYKLSRYEGLVCDVFPILWQAGGDPLQPGGPGAIEAVEFMLQLSKAFNPAVRSYKEQTILDAQQLREIVLHPNWPFAVAQLRGKGMLPGPMQTAPLPAGPAGRATVLGGGYLGVPATAPRPIEAGQLLDYLTSGPTQRRLVEKLGWFPIREEGWEAFSEEDRTLYAGFLAMREHVRARPNVAAYAEISQVWQEGIHAILFDDEVPAAALARMQAEIDALVAGQ